MYTLETIRYAASNLDQKMKKKKTTSPSDVVIEKTEHCFNLSIPAEKKALSESFPPSTFWPSHHNDQKKSLLILKAFTFPLLTHFVHLGQITCFFTKCLISEIQQELPISTIRRSGGLFSHLKSMKYMLYPPLKTDIPLQIDPWVR